jgi:hypothetical protein
MFHGYSKRLGLKEAELKTCYELLDVEVIKELRKVDK